MALIPPSGYETLSQLRGALRNGAIKEYNGVIGSVKIDGVDAGDDLPRGVSGSITYDVVLTDTDAEVENQLTGMVPSSRVGSNLRVVAPRRLTPCKIVVSSVGGTRKLYFFPYTPEQSDPYSCDGSPVLETNP